MILEPKFNQEKLEVEKFMILDSEIGFDNKQFAKDIKEEIDYLGLSKVELGLAVKIGTDRLTSVLRGEMQFRAHEIENIKKFLHMD
jgi:hypothetical protein